MNTPEIAAARDAEAAQAAAHDASETAAATQVRNRAVTFPTFATVTLRRPLKRGDTEVKSVGLMVPDSGQLRGLSLVAVARLEVDTLGTLVARISQPHVSAEEYSRMHPKDMLAIGGEIAGFFED